MKLFKLLSTLSCLFLSANMASADAAYDFMVDGLCYNKNADGKSVTVTYQNSISPSYSSLDDELVIPPTVTYSGTTYSVTSIDYYAFRGCSGLTSLTIPNSVTEIGAYSFSGCSGLTSLTIPDSVTEIGSSAFYNTAWYNNQPNGLVYAGKVAYKYKGSVPSGTRIVINEGTVSISPSCFYNCSGLTFITIPNSVTSIGGYSFSGCSGLTSVTIGNSVTEIGDHAFFDCSGLTSVTIPNSVTSIGDHAFFDCSGLTSVTIGNSVTSIGEYAFYNCNGLTKIEISDLSAWCGITFDGEYSNPLYYAKHLFLNGSEIKDLVIPDSVSQIGTYAFIGCSVLTSLTTPNSVTSIGYKAFKDCKMLQSLIIGSSVNTINNYAFSGCNYLMDVTNYAEIPQVINANVFENVDLSLCNLYVLENSYKFYIREPVWKDFIVKVAGVEGVEVDEATKVVDGYYDLNGIRLEEPARGQVNIFRYTDGTSKKIIIE